MPTREFDRLTPYQQNLISEFHSNGLAKLGSLAKKIGISSIKIASMRVGTSGQISKEGNDYIIKVNRNEARERQRFTIAHELSHFLLHRSIIDREPDGITDNVLYRSGAPENIEFEANRLAAEILMPANYVRVSLEKDFQNVITDATIESLAEKFQVSKAAMEVRLSSLS